MNRAVASMPVRLLLTWTLVCLAPEGLAGVLAAVEPPMATEAIQTPAAPAPEPPVAEVTPPDAVVIVRHDHGSRIRIGGSVVVERGERVDDVVAVLGSVTVRGEVTGSAVAVGGNVHVEDGASVGGEVVAVGGRIIAAPTARLSGSAEQIAIDFPEITRIGPDGPDVIFRVLPDWQRISGALIGVSLFRLGSLLLLGLAAALVFRSMVGRVADRVADAPLEALVIGVGLQILLLPALIATCLALAISVIGLPLVPVLLVAGCGLWLVGFAGAVAAAGRGVLRMAGLAQPSLLASFVLGGLPFALLTAGSRIAWWSRGELAGWPMAAAIAGLVIEGAFWSLGAGGLALAWLRREAPSAALAGSPPAPPAPAVPVQL